MGCFIWMAINTVANVCIVAIINYIVSNSNMQPMAMLALVPTCLGVYHFSYYDSQSVEGVQVITTTPLDIIYAFLGIIASPLYTIWINTYQRRLQMDSMQLLYNQAPLASIILLYFIPFMDKATYSSFESPHPWLAITMVGRCLASFEWPLR